MIIKGVELPDLNLADLAVAEKFEQQLVQFEDISKQAAADGISRTEQIRTICTGTFEALNALWGDGTDKKVFGDTVNITDCYEAMRDVVAGAKEIDEKNSLAITEMTQALTQKYAPNRTARRSAKKQ